MNFTAGFFEPGSGDPLGFYVMILAMFVHIPGTGLFVQQKRLDIVPRNQMPDLLATPIG